MWRHPTACILVSLVATASARAVDRMPSVELLAPGYSHRDLYTVVGPRNLAKQVEPLNADGSANAIVEVPAGTNEKWEIDRKTGEIVWQRKGDTPHLIRYLGYPANYGAIPKTRGAGQDLLDVVILGRQLLRGEVVQTRIIGALKLLDGDERDDKLIAVLPDGPFGGVTDLTSLNVAFPGVAQLLEIWFSNYKGAGKTKFLWFADADEAKALLDAGIRAAQKP